MGKAKAKRNPDAPGISPEVLLQAARTLEEASSWILFSHMKLDGDAIGTATALFEAGMLRGKRVRWMGPDPMPSSYRFLPHTESYSTRREYPFDEGDDLYVVLDSSNEERGVAGLRDRAPGAFVLNIDHHGDNSRFGTFNCVDSSASSTSELMWHVMTAGGWSITAEMAVCLYTGIFADTGGFVFSNTTEATHEVAADLLRRGVRPPAIDAALRQNRSLEGMHLWGIALARAECWGDEKKFALSWLAKEDFGSTGADMTDTEALVNQLLRIRGVRFAVLVTDELSADRSGVKASFRSREAMVEAVAVAHLLGGGGHPRASGASLNMAMDEAVRLIRETTDKAYAEWLSAGQGPGQKNE
jgi:phosphoesterase RecJ-like protein